MDFMLEELYEKFKKLDKLYEERDRIYLEEIHIQNHKKLKLIIDNTLNLRLFIERHKISPKDIKMVQNHATKKMYAVTEISEMKILVEILHILNMENSLIEDLINNIINRTYLEIGDLPIAKRVSVLEDFKCLDRGSSIKEYLNKLIDGEIVKFRRTVDMDPVKLDKWLNNLTELYIKMVGVGKNVVQIRDDYYKHEIIYLNLCLKILSQGDQNILVEDLIFLIHKIQKRSNIYNMNLNFEIGRIIFNFGFTLSTADIKFLTNLL
jgi:hypothetical protein